MLCTTTDTNLVKETWNTLTFAALTSGWQTDSEQRSDRQRVWPLLSTQHCATSRYIRGDRRHLSLKRREGAWPGRPAWIIISFCVIIIHRAEAISRCGQNAVPLYQGHKNHKLKGQNNNKVLNETQRHVASSQESYNICKEREGPLGQRSGKKKNLFTGSCWVCLTSNAQCVCQCRKHLNVCVCYRIPRLY